MGNPILNAVRELREGNPLFVDRKNKNRYMVVAGEEDGSKTAYCFAVPVYDRNRKLINLKFCKNGNEYIAEGSNCKVKVTEGFTFENADGKFFVNPIDGFEMKSAFDTVIHGNSCIVSPTLNGLVFKARCINGKYTFRLHTDRLSFEIKENGKYFSILKDAMRPIITVSCIGCADNTGRVIAPAILEYYAESQDCFVISVVSHCSYSTYVAFEINMYDRKLFQDTTVETENPDVNNVYGGTAFVGKTDLFGEQWLYSRPDFSCISDITQKEIKKVILHLSQFNKGPTLSVYRIENRFCSFGSNWNNKVKESGILKQFIQGDFRQSVDLTELLVDPLTGRLKPSHGFLIKIAVRDSGFSVMSTGDSFFAPLIIEINYR